MIPRIPSAAIVVNQMSMTGPNMCPTDPVPKRWIAKRTTMIATVIGTTRLLIEDEIVSVPSTAESTEIAGVIMLSPKTALRRTTRARRARMARPGTSSPIWTNLRDQRHDPALPVVVGAHHQADVLDVSRSAGPPRRSGRRRRRRCAATPEWGEDRPGRMRSGSCRWGWCRYRRRQPRGRRPRAPSWPRRALRRRPCGNPMPSCCSSGSAALLRETTVAASRVRDQGCSRQSCKDPSAMADVTVSCDERSGEAALSVERLPPPTSARPPRPR